VIHIQFSVSIRNTPLVQELLAVILVAYACLNTSAQQQQEYSFDSLSFNKNLELAKWLYEYDEISMLAEESLKSPGNENLSAPAAMRFCYKDAANNWHFHSGLLINGEYHPNINYEIDSLYVIHPEALYKDSTVSACLSNALIHCRDAIESITDSSKIHLNQYVRILPDHTLEVWIFPSFQPSGQAIYGVEWMFHLNPGGTALLDSYHYNSGIKGVWIGRPRELWLNYRDTGVPTPGSVFFAWSFKDYFTKVHISSQNQVSNLQKDAAGKYYWNHTANTHTTE
jgi:hypothetical protein